MFFSRKQNESILDLGKSQKISKNKCPTDILSKLGAKEVKNQEYKTAF